MSYQINRTDGTFIGSVADRSFRSDIVPLTLLGRWVSNYGDAYNENFVRLIENFNNTTAPENPMEGMLWFDRSSGSLKLYKSDGSWGTISMSSGETITLQNSDGRTVLGNNGIIDLHRTDGTARIQFHNSLNGSAQVILQQNGSSLAVLGGGTVKIGTSDVWHAGNFNPATKANLSGAAFTGTVTATSPAFATQATIDGHVVWHAGNLDPGSLGGGGSGGDGTPTTDLYTSTGTWTAPSGVTSVVLTGRGQSGTAAVPSSSSGWFSWGAAEGSNEIVLPSVVHVYEAGDTGSTLLLNTSTGFPNNVSPKPATTYLDLKQQVEAYLQRLNAGGPADRVISYATLGANTGSPATGAQQTTYYGSGDPANWATVRYKSLPIQGSNTVRVRGLFSGSVEWVAHDPEDWTQVPSASLTPNGWTFSDATNIYALPPGYMSISSRSTGEVYLASGSVAATTGLPITAFGKSFPGGIGGQAPELKYTVTVVPGTAYTFTVPSGGYLAITYNLTPPNPDLYSDAFLFNSDTNKDTGLVYGGTDGVLTLKTNNVNSLIMSPTFTRIATNVLVSATDAGEAGVSIDKAGYLVVTKSDYPAIEFRKTGLDTSANRKMISYDAATDFMDIRPGARVAGKVVSHSPYDPSVVATKYHITSGTYILDNAGGWMIDSANRLICAKTDALGAYTQTHFALYPNMEGVGQGGTSTSTLLELNGRITTTGSVTAGTAINAGSTVYAPTGFLTDGFVNGATATFSGAVAVGSIGSAGNITANGDVTAFSDVRLKSEIADIENALEIVAQLRGRRYTKDGRRSIGVIAQEIQEWIPEVVFENEDGMLSVAYGNLVAILIEAVKALDTKVYRLESSFSSLERRLARLEAN